MQKIAKRSLQVITIVIIVAFILNAGSIIKMAKRIGSDTILRKNINCPPHQ